MKVETLNVVKEMSQKLATNTKNKEDFLLGMYNFILKLGNKGSCK